MKRLLKKQPRYLSYYQGLQISPWDLPQNEHNKTFQKSFSIFQEFQRPLNSLQKHISSSLPKIFSKNKQLKELQISKLDNLHKTKHKTSTFTDQKKSLNNKDSLKNGKMMPIINKYLTKTNQKTKTKMYKTKNNHEYSSKQKSSQFLLSVSSFQLNTKRSTSNVQQKTQQSYTCYQQTNIIQTNKQDKQKSPKYNSQTVNVQKDKLQKEKQINIKSNNKLPSQSSYQATNNEKTFQILFQEQKKDTKRLKFNDYLKTIKQNEQNQQLKYRHSLADNKKTTKKQQTQILKNALHDMHPLPINFQSLLKRRIQREIGQKSLIKEPIKQKQNISFLEPKQKLSICFNRIDKSKKEQNQKKLRKFQKQDLSQLKVFQNRKVRLKRNKFNHTTNQLNKVDILYSNKNKNV